MCLIRHPTGEANSAPPVNLLDNFVFSVFTENRERRIGEAKESARRVRCAMGRTGDAVGNQPDDGADPRFVDDRATGADDGRSDGGLAGEPRECALELEGVGGVGIDPCGGEKGRET